MKTIWIEFHSYRGFHLDPTLFGPVLRLGWIGIGKSTDRLTVWVARWYATITQAVKP